MKDALLKIAVGLEQAAAGYRKMAEAIQKGENHEQKSEPQMAAEASGQVSAVSIEDLRAILAAKSQDGKTREIKSLLLKFGASRLSEVKPESYRVLFTEAKQL